MLRLQHKPTESSNTGVPVTNKPYFRVLMSYRACLLQEGWFARC
jgi:hypothetical protein